jgi:cytochrome c oxidase subunit 4
MTESNAHSHHPDEHVRSLFVVYFVLMGLLVLTVSTALLMHLGWFNIVLAMAIALTKAAMVIWIFMHVKYGGRLVWVFASAAFVWLGIMLIYSVADYSSRGVIPKGDLMKGAPPAQVDSEH